MRKFLSLIECCFNWKVVAGLGLVAVGIGLLQPQLFVASLPTLALLICPLSMGVMAIMMWRNQGNSSHQQAVSYPPAHAPINPDPLIDAQTRLTALQARQVAIAREIADLERPEPNVLADAEAIVQHAHGQHGAPHAVQRSDH